MGVYDQWLFGYDGEERGVRYTQVAPGVRLYDVRDRFSDAFVESATEKIGYAVHHDAVAGALPQTLDEELARIAAIHRYHTVNNGWGGIGYHRIISPATGNTFLTGASGSQRAHVAGLNHLWIGYCFMGDWSNGRPPEPGMSAFRTMTQWETDRRGVEMRLRPHKGLNPGTTECPGGWAAADAWETLVIKPGTVPFQPPPPPPPERSLAERTLDEIYELVLAERAARER